MKSLLSARTGSVSSIASDHKKKKGIAKLFAKKEKNGSLEFVIPSAIHSIGRYFRPGNAQRGEVEMAIRYVDATSRLEVILIRRERGRDTVLFQVRLLRARYLRPISKEGKANPYVSCCLVQVDDGKIIEKKKTATLTNTLEPVYDNQ